jgi:broad specificity phosphatase PhoE
MLKPGEVLLIRHGETEWSITGQHSGRCDLPLTARGEDEALEIGRLLAGQTFDCVICSPLQRAIRTCEIAGYLRTAQIEPDLQEWDYGDCTGFTQDQMRERYPGWTVWSGPLPNGETAGDVVQRASRVIERLRQSRQRTAIFAHGHFLRVFATQWLGIAPESGRHFALETSAYCILGEDAGFPAIVAWNVKRAAADQNPVLSPA